MKIGDSDFAMAEVGDLSILKWRDTGKKSVIVINYLHNPNVKNKVLRTNKVLEKVLDAPKSYQIILILWAGLIFLINVIPTIYSVSWKSRRWWMKMFYYLLDASIVNSYILYKTSVVLANRKPISHLQFTDT